MHRDPRHNPLFARRAAQPKADADLSRLGEELAKLRRLGAPEGGFAKAPPPVVPAAPAPTPPKPPIFAAPPVTVGEKRRSELALPQFVPPPGPAPVPPPQPARRRLGPTPVRTVQVRNVVQLATALEQARPGDHIVLADGEYVMPNKRYKLAGTAEHPITLAGFGRHAVLVCGNNPHTLQLDRCEHVMINGLRFAQRRTPSARALNVTDSNHVTIVGCWIGEGAEGKEVAPVHFGADASGRYNNHNLVLGNVIYACGSAAVHFGPGGGQGARVVDNELRAVGAEGRFAPLVQFTPGAMAVYRGATVRGNRLIAEAPSGGGFALNGVVGADVSGNTVRLKRDVAGRAGSLLEVRADAAAGGQVTGLVVHHNELGYDRPGPADAPAAFVFAAPVQATFAHNVAEGVGDRPVDGRFAALVDLSSGLERV